MSSLFLLPVGEPDGPLLDRLRRDLQRELRVPTTILPERLDPSFAFHAERQQYHSTQILAQLAPFVNDRCWRIVGITSHDLYMPILTFVFGEAQLGGRCAIVSAQRLAQPFYGLPPDDELTAARLLKETVHELGHTLDLTHCQDYSCVMASSHSVEWIDIKSADFCRECHARVSSSIPVKRLLGIF